MTQLLHKDGTVTVLDELQHNGFLTIGSSDVCEIRLAGKDVLRKHARLIRRQSLFYIHPLQPKGPVLVNNYPCASGQDVMLQHRDMIAIGTWTMQFVEGQLAAASDDTIADATQQAALNNREEFKHRMHAALLDRLDLKGLEQAGGANRDQMMDKQARAFIRDILHEHAEEVAALGNTEELYQEIIDDILGYGPLDALLRDDEVSEIMCVGPAKIYVERKGRLSLSPRKFQDNNQLRAIIERIVGPLGRRIDESSPIVDARLPDGSRVNAIIQPVSLDGCSLNIRKFPNKSIRVDDLLSYGSLSPGMARFLQLAVERRRNIVIAGGTGSGKTTLLDIVSSFIPASERIVTIEDSAELRLGQEHVVRLETRPPNIEGKGAISIRDLVKNALRMRPDRIIVGECRGGEALDMLQAMNTGHDGSLTTLHANSPLDAISRLETMVLMAGMELPLRAIRSQIASAVHVICQQARLSDGSRKITSIAEVVSDPDDEEGTVKLQDLFLFTQTDVTPEGGIRGFFRPTGIIPDFVARLRRQGTDVDMAMFVIDN